MLLLVIVMFDINEKLDAMLLAPLKETVFKYFLNFLPGFINQFAPMFVFITVIFFTSKLADRCEITAILSSGISFNRLAVPYIVSAVFISIGTLVLGEKQASGLWRQCATANAPWRDVSHGAIRQHHQAWLSHFY